MLTVGYELNLNGLLSVFKEGYIILILDLRSFIPVEVYCVQSLEQ